MDLLKKVKSGASKAAEVAQQTVEMTKLAAQVHAKKRQIDKYMSHMGQEIYAAYKAGDLAFAERQVNECCLAIQALEAEIAALEKQMKRLRNERMCACGKTLSWDVKFCPDCGRPNVDPGADVIPIDAEPRS